MTEYLILAAAAFFARMLNRVAGAGTFLTFPALVYTGMPPVSANATSAVAVFPGYLGGAFGFSKEIAGFERMWLLKIVAFTTIGGLVGSLLLMVSSEVFSLVIPFLLALATFAFAFGPRIQAWASRRGSRNAEGSFGTFLVSIHGELFQRRSWDRPSGSVLALGDARHQRDERLEGRTVLRALGHFRRDLCSGRPRRLAAGSRPDGSSHGGRIRGRACRSSAACGGGQTHCHRSRHDNERRLLAGICMSRAPIPKTGTLLIRH